MKLSWAVTGETPFNPTNLIVSHTLPSPPSPPLSACRCRPSTPAHFCVHRRRRPNPHNLHHWHRPSSSLPTSSTFPAAVATPIHSHRIQWIGGDDLSVEMVTTHACMEITLLSPVGGDLGWGHRGWRIGDRDKWEDGECDGACGEWCGSGKVVSSWSFFILFKMSFLSYLCSFWCCVVLHLAGVALLLMGNNNWIFLSVMWMEIIDAKSI